MAQPDKHRVRPGDTLPSIAQEHGFSSLKTIWDHPDNAALRKTRPNPNVLNPGDEVALPVRQVREESGATEQRHRFRTRREPLLLRVKVLDLDGEAVHRTCLYQDETQVTIAPENDGAYEARIDPRVRAAHLRLTGETPDEPVIEVDLDVGGLNTVDDPQGQQDRLNNLGYFAGFSRTSLGTAQFQWAVEEFQCDHKLAVDGVCGKATQAELEKRHGV